ncbi:accessory Sec system protein Asp3, partial [Streptococcus pneumoniae]|nr:accessory Sec system protein Asp3 [Streptococcus pneumoniae]
MVIRRQKEIFWGEFKGASLGNLRENSFLYGSIVIYYARNHIYFENEMISSGTMV